MRKKVYIWGAGHYGVLTALDLEQKGVKIEGFIDKNANQIKTRLGLPVLEFNEGQFKNQDFRIIIAVQNEDAIKNVSEMLLLVGLEFEISSLIPRPQLKHTVLNKIARQKSNFEIVRYIDVSVPITTCNFRCHYCYITHKRLFSNSLPKFVHTAAQIAQAFSQKRLGGICVINLCAAGETLLAPEMPGIVRALLEEGHIIMVVTNGSMSKRFDDFVKFPQELRNRLFIKFSFHYLELLRLKMLDNFFDNLQKMKNNGISFTLEITPNDELFSHIEDIKKISIERAGALPHITVARNERHADLPILTELSREEYKKTWSQFNSQLFDFKLSVFNVKQTDFCYGGKATYSVGLDDGILKQCYREKTLMNLYDDINQSIKEEPVGCNCHAPHCWNAHFWMGFGTVPAKNKISPLYAEMRNRTCTDGTEWIVGDVKRAFGTRANVGTSGKILVYHKLAEISRDDLTVDLQIFEEQMMFLRNKKVVHLDDYEPENPDNVVIRFDDGDRQSIYHAIDILKKFNYPFEVFVCGSFWNKAGRIGDNDVSEILQNGGRLQYHTHTHSLSLTEMDEQELEFEIKVPDNLKNIGNSCFNWLAYPYWKWNEKIKNIAKKYFKGALSGNGLADNTQYALDGVRMDNRVFSIKILQKVRELRNIIFEQLSPLIEHSNCWLLEVPYYSNIGDVLIWAGEEYFLNKVKNVKCLYCASYDTFIPRQIDNSTVILLQGGGNFGDLWAGPHNFRKQIIASYPNNKIIIFPQTIFYEDEEKLKNDAQLFNNHKNLTICARDKISYEIFKKHFTANILLVPDMAFCILPESLEQYKKNSICKSLFVKREDKELNIACNYDEFESNCDTTDWLAKDNFALMYLKEFLQMNQKSSGQFTGFIDFYANSTFKNYMIKEGVELLSRYEKIYTTRLHCAILCCLLGKPVSLFDNSYGKNKNFYETWLQGIDDVEFISTSTPLHSFPFLQTQRLS